MTHEQKKEQETDRLSRQTNPMDMLQGLYLNSIEIKEVDPRKLMPKEAPGHSTADFGVPMFPLAKVLGRDPTQIADNVVEQLKAANHPWIKNAKVEGNYANIELDINIFGRDIVSQILAEGSEYGKEDVGQGRRIVIDMSSPNIAKRMSYGHLRSTIIGDSLARIYRATGHEVIRDNHIGDWGTQFGKLIEAIKLWGDEEAIINSEDPVGELQNLYVQFHDEIDKEMEQSKEDIRQRLLAGEDVKGYKDIVESLAQAVVKRKNLGRNEVDMEKVEADAIDRLATSKLEVKGREWFKKLEGGDPEARRIWQLCIDLSMKEFEKIYGILGVKFEEVLGESFYEPMLQDVMREVSESDASSISNGALVVDMQDANLGVVGEDQKLYFQQLFEILRRLGHPIGDNSTHVYFGMVSLKEGKMSTRKGRVILLKDVIDEGLSRADALLAEQEVFQENPELRADTARKVAVGALKWNDLYQGAERSIVFDWDTALNFDGESGPYVQYAAVRANTILEKAGTNIEEVKQLRVEETEEVYQSKPERELTKSLAQYSSALTEALETNGPNKITEYVYKLAKLYSQFYREVSVLRAETETQKATRLRLCVATAHVITNSLGLLGIEVPQRM
ncbi:MAG: Arginine-tRNA ligase [Candidatus Woesebacteria bacterium GW2011_GWB1_38_5b]|uniref:arginine--tRNA ligase n=1 Tax=Candidatus Woesebacteria bacterium GW2011_GWB1_38_5b TaxID=1618569 RepID=A0A0G0NAQ2_9BACT|nr:MAG: Arginine-tRNA ligase [Candidatus Woesebacteria bacterium GW2011_GWB1_38_5b]